MRAVGYILARAIYKCSTVRTFPHVRFIEHTSARYLKRKLYLTIALAVLGGCAKEPAPATVAPVKIMVTSSDFCGVMRRLHGQGGKPTWSVDDTAETITQVRRLGAAFDQRCGVSKPVNPTS